MHCFENSGGGDELSAPVQSRMRAVFSTRWNKTGMEAMHFDDLPESRCDF
ncbi:hypothetical protein [Azospirillum largimobile]